MAEIYTKSVIKIGNETFRNLPAQVDRDQEVSYDANLKSQQAISTANAAQAKANEAKTAADAAQETANAAQTKADEAYNLADSATELATEVQGELADALGSKVVRYDETQLLSEEQMITARGNIEAAPITGTVRYDINQSLTDAQKTKARTNIGAGTPVTVDQNLIENSTNPVAGGAVYRETTTNRNAITNLQGLLMDFAQDSAVRYDMAQTLTDEQKAQARANIGAGTGGGGGSTDGAVLYSQAQNLTDEQKAQARANIGAGTGGDGAVLYNQAQTLTYQQKSQARTNIDAAPANLDYVKYNGYQLLSATQKAQARKNINAASGFVNTNTNTPNINAIETKTVYDYTVLEYIFDAQYDAQNRYTSNYDMTLFVIHNNQSLYSSNITATLYEGAVTSSGNITYNKVAEMLVPGTNKTFAIGCFRNYAHQLVQPVYSINATNLNCQVALGIANFNITELSSNTSYATQSPAAFDLINKGNNQINYKLVFSGINDGTVISRFGGFYNA